MKSKSFFIFLFVVIFVIGCAPQQQTKAAESSTAPSAEKTTSSEIKETAKDDFGCWPPSCSFIPDAQGPKNTLSFGSGPKY